MRRVVLLLLALASALATALPFAPASAQGPQGAPGVTLVLCCPEAGWPPYNIPCASGPGCGIMPDIFLEAARALGAAVVIRNFPEKRSLLLLEEGRVDVYSKAKQWVPDPERFAWSTPVLPSRDVLAALADGPRAIDGPADLAGLRLGTVLGYSYPVLEEALASGAVTRDDAPDTVTQLRKLLHGRTDAAVVNELVARWVLRDQGEGGADALRFSRGAVGLAWLRFAFTRARDWEPFIARLDAEIERMRADGRLRAILDAYH